MALVLAFDIERSGATSEYTTFAVGGSVVDADFREIDSVLILGPVPTREEEFEPRCWKEFWSKHTDKLEQLKALYECKREDEVALMEKFGWKSPPKRVVRCRDMSVKTHPRYKYYTAEYHMANEVQAFRVKCEATSAEQKVEIKLCSDNVVYDFGHINELITAHTQELPMPYSATEPRTWGIAYDTTSQQKVLMQMLLPGYKLGWGWSNELLKLAGKEYGREHDHVPHNDAFTIAFDQQVIDQTDWEYLAFHKQINSRNTDQMQLKPRVVNLRCEFVAHRVKKTIEVQLYLVAGLDLETAFNSVVNTTMLDFGQVYKIHELAHLTKPPANNFICLTASSLCEATLPRVFSIAPTKEAPEHTASALEALLKQKEHNRMHSTLYVHPGGTVQCHEFSKELLATPTSSPAAQDKIADMNTDNKPSDEAADEQRVVFAREKRKAEQFVCRNAMERIISESLLIRSEAHKALSSLQEMDKDDEDERKEEDQDTKRQKKITDHATVAVSPMTYKEIVQVMADIRMHQKARPDALDDLEPEATTVRLLEPAITTVQELGKSTLELAVDRVFAETVQDKADNAVEAMEEVEASEASTTDSALHKGAIHKIGVCVKIPGCSVTRGYPIDTALEEPSVSVVRAFDEISKYLSQNTIGESSPAFSNDTYVVIRDEQGLTFPRTIYIPPATCNSFDAAMAILNAISSCLKEKNLLTYKSGNADGASISKAPEEEKANAKSSSCGLGPVSGRELRVAIFLGGAMGACFLDIDLPLEERIADNELKVAMRTAMDALTKAGGDPSKRPTTHYVELVDAAGRVESQCLALGDNFKGGFCDVVDLVVSTLAQKHPCKQHSPLVITPVDDSEDA